MSSLLKAVFIEEKQI